MSRSYVPRPVKPRIVSPSEQGGLTGADGNPLKDASGFANVLNYITMMDYDISGSWTATTGPNGPLYSRGATAEQAAGADTGVNYWTSVGMPKNKLVLGIPAYGKMFTLNSNTLATTWNNGVSTIDAEVVRS